MIQQQTMIFWGHAEKKDIEQIFVEFLNIIAIFDSCKAYIDSFQVKQGTSYKDCNSVDLNALLKSGVNREGNLSFAELGYRVNFRFKLFGEKTYGSLVIGASGINCKNTLRIVIPHSIDLSDSNHSSCIIDLFNRFSSTGIWFWGAVIDNITLNRLGSLFNNGTPTTVHWMNYYGDEFGVLSTLNTIKHMKGLEGIIDNERILVLDRVPIDAQDYENNLLRESLNNLLFGK